MEREKNLLKLLNSLDILLNDLNRLIVQYNAIIEWETTASTMFKMINHEHYGIFGYQEHLYLCTIIANLIIKYNLQGEIIEENNSFKGPTVMDIDIKKNLFYIVGSTHVILVSLQNQKELSSWLLPAIPPQIFRALKVEENIVYLTLYGLHQIFVCASNDGKLLNKFGKEPTSSEPGAFFLPLGLTVVQNILYICDRENHRIQLLTKDKGEFISLWGTKGRQIGELSFPEVIFYEELENIFYVGDWFCVQLFLPRDNGEMQCIQRLGSHITVGIFVMEDRLFVSDYGNKRILIYRRKEESF